jgi:TatD DNase family protein
MKEWKKNGLEYVVSVSSNFSESLRSIELHKKYEEIIPGIGIHPWKAKTSLTDEQKNKFNQIIIENLPVVLGEFGLDYHFIKKEEYYAHQEETFRFFLNLAEKHNLPINVHLKGAEGLGAEILETYNIPSHKILIHWYSGPENILKEFIERDYFFSINPSILGGSKHIIVLIQAGLNQILTESDGNVKYTIDDERIVGSPAIIPKIIEKICEEKEKDVQEIANILHSNLRTYLNIG